MSEVLRGTVTRRVVGRTDIGDALRAAAKDALGDDALTGRYQIRVEIAEVPADERPQGDST